MDTLDNRVHRQDGDQVMLDAPPIITTLGTAIAVVSLVVTLGKGLIVVVRVGKGLAVEMGFLKL
jgi:hypothetical protein